MQPSSPRVLLLFFLVPSILLACSGASSVLPPPTGDGGPSSVTRGLDADAGTTPPGPVDLDASLDAEPGHEEPDQDASLDAGALPPLLDDASAPVRACGACIEEVCAAPAAACKANPACTETVTCTIESGCYGVDAGSPATCIDACLGGLAPKDALRVATELKALVQCGTPCATTCTPSTGGG